MTRTPDEIKKGLEEEIPVHYHIDGEPRLTPRMLMDMQWLHKDALALIQQLEAERDAAVEALTKIVQKHDESFCEHCDNWDRYTCPPSCWTYCERFKWRGVQEEE